jgi:hypothetical protein
MQKELRSNGYFSTLTMWTLLLTAYVLAFPSPAGVVAAASAANIVVCALYYSIVNQKLVSGTSFLLHGGCALALLLVVCRGSLDCKARPLTAALVTGTFLGANAAMQVWHEQQHQKVLYPTCKNFENPLWRLVAVPAIGAAVAASLAAWA